MKARYTFAVLAVAALFAAPASASVISASSQTARSKPADQVDYLRVTTLQNDLNASLREVADASAPAALAPRSAPTTTSGGFLIGSDANASANYEGLSGNAMENLFDPSSDKQITGISRDSNGTSGVFLGGGTPDTYGNNGGKGNKNDGGKGGKGKGKWGKGGGGGTGGGVQAAPEPSTWLLLSSGLAMFGAYALLRRKS
jgi:uncharacterized membrane protein YgcG